MLQSFKVTGVSRKIETVGVDEISIPSYLPEMKCAVSRYEEICNSTLDLASQTGEITVRPVGDKYEILAGFDYYSAYKELFPRGQIVVKIYNYCDEDAVNVAISLNSAEYCWTVIDFANAYSLSLDAFGWDKSALARALGKARATVSNTLRMNDLDPIVMSMIRDGKIKSEHGKHLCRLNHSVQVYLAKKCIENNWNTRELYNEIKGTNQTGVENVSYIDEAHGDRPRPKDSNITYVENTLSDVLGCSVNLDVDSKKDYSGVMELDIYSLSELQGISDKIRNNGAETTSVGGTIKLCVKNSEHLNKIISAFVNPEEF